jgi:hypothetical protein
MTHLLVAAIAALAVTAAQAELIVDFQSTAGASDVDPASAWVGRVYSLPFTTGQVFYTAGTNGMPETWGGYWCTNTDASSTPNRAVSLNGSNFRMGWANADSTSGTWIRFRYLYMAPEHNWETSPAQITGFVTNSFLNVRARNQNIEGDTSVNFVVLDGGAYYISSNRVDGNEIHIDDPNSANWQPFDATAENFGDVDPFNITGAPHTFSNIEGVGVFLDGLDYAQGFLARFANDTWQVDAVVIPEPALGLLSMLGLALLRRMRG